MKAIKLMILGALLILLGPIMSAIDVYWNGFHLTHTSKQKAKSFLQADDVSTPE